MATLALPENLLPTVAEAGDQRNLAVSQEAISYGPTAWTFADRECEWVLRFGSASNLRYLEEKMSSSVDVIDDILLHTPNLPTQSYHSKPERVGESYLPFRRSLPAGTSLLRESMPLPTTKRTAGQFSHFMPPAPSKAERKAGRLLQVGNTIFPEHLYQKLDRYIRQAEEDAQVLLEMTGDESQIDLRIDITPANALIDEKTQT